MLLKISLIVLVASLAIIFPIIVGGMIVRDKKYMSKPLYTIFVYSVIYAIFEIVGWYYALHHLQNHFLVNIFSYLDIVFWSYYFYQILSNKISKGIVMALFSLTLTFNIFSHLFLSQDFNRLDSFAISVSYISLIMMSILYFYQLLNSLEINDLFQYPHFWINSAVLIYFSGSFFMFIYGEYITFSADESINQYSLINDYLLFFHRIFLAIGLWFSKTPIQSNLSSN